MARIFAYTVFGLALLTALGSVEAQEPKRGGTVITTVQADPNVINPAISTSPPDGITGCMVYEALTKVSGERIMPLLAKSWTVSPDGKTYSFKLNQANWQDGKPFTSADVKFSLLEINAKYTPAFAPTSGRLIEGIDTPAPDEVVIRLKQAFGPLIRTLSCNQGGVLMPKHVFEGSDIFKNPAIRAPMGTGPFKLQEWKHGDFLRLVRNDDYWQKGKPYLDSVIVKVVPQPSARTQALITGETDFVSYYIFPTNDLPQVRNNPKYTLTETKIPPSQSMVLINVTRKPLNDKRVRHALFMATDREYLAKTAWLGMGPAAIAPFNSKLTWAANPDIDYRKMYPFDVARANALFDEAGYKRDASGTRFTLHVVFASDEVNFGGVAVALKSMWKAVGVDLVVDAMDRQIAEKRAFEEGDFDLHLNNYTSGGDPAIGLARIFVTSSIGKTYGNASRYNNPEIDRLFIEAEQGVDQESRGKIYQKIQAILAEDLPVFTLREGTAYDVYTSAIQGLDNDAYFPTWADAWLKK